MQIPATVITKVSGSLVSDDGQQMALKLLQPDGTDLVLAIPRYEILNLVDVAAHARSQSDKILKVDPKTSVGHRVIWWDLAIDDTTNQVVLTLTFGAGGKLADPGRLDFGESVAGADRHRVQDAALHELCGRSGDRRQHVPQHPGGDRDRGTVRAGVA